jgi:hypothetical protein
MKGKIMLFRQKKKFPSIPIGLTENDCFLEITFETFNRIEIRMLTHNSP